jgi:hypothetical protein
VARSLGRGGAATRQLGRRRRAAALLGLLARHFARAEDASDRVEKWLHAHKNEHCRAKLLD